MVSLLRVALATRCVDAADVRLHHFNRSLWQAQDRLAAPMAICGPVHIPHSQTSCMHRCRPCRRDQLQHALAARSSVRRTSCGRVMKIYRRHGHSGASRHRHWHQPTQFRSIPCGHPTGRARYAYAWPASAQMRCCLIGQRRGSARSLAQSIVPRRQAAMQQAILARTARSSQFMIEPSEA